MFILAAFLISIGATIIGSICGIGGGLIIKPLLDTFGFLSVSVISFLSGCTVLAMTAYSFVRGRLSGDSHVDLRRTTVIAIGSALGGFLGQSIFDAMCLRFAASENVVGAWQAALLLLMVAVSLVYTLKRDKIKGKNVQSLLLCLLGGVFLGALSSFIGIGGGPINMVFLYYFFSMPAKAAAQNSLYIILFAQTASLVKSLVTASVPSFDPWLLVLMIAGGIAGGIIGRRINKRLGDRQVNLLYILLMIAVIVMNAFNFVSYLH